MQVIEAQCSWSWRLTITSISTRSGRRPAVRSARSYAYTTRVQHGAGRPPPRPGCPHIEGGPARLTEARVPTRRRETKADREACTPWEEVVAVGRLQRMPSRRSLATKPRLMVAGLASGSG